MSHNKWYVGIDLGGTSIKLAMLTETGELAFKTQEPTNVSGGGDQVLQQMNQMIEKGLQSLDLQRHQLKGVGIGAPAFLDMDKGFVYEAVNLGWTDFPLKERLQELTHLPVVVDNDANTAALGEMWKGAGEGTSELLCITLGTGVGGGVIIHGQIYHGARGTAGEIGHFTVVPDGGFECNCGKSGCLETIASATGIVRLATRYLEDKDHEKSMLHLVLRNKGKIEAVDVALAAQEGDPLSSRIVQEVGHALGLVLGNYAIVMNPKKIVIGGGVSKAGDILFQPIRTYYDKYALPKFTGNVDIVPATLGNDAGVFGSAWLVHTKL